MLIINRFIALTLLTVLVAASSGLTQTPGGKKNRGRKKAAVQQELAVKGQELAVQLSYQPPGSAQPSNSPFAKLAGDGNGNIIDSPEYLLPYIQVKVYGESQLANTGLPANLICSEIGPQGVRGGRRWLALTDESGKVVASTKNYIEARSSGKHGRKAVTLIPAEGCVVRCELEDKRTGTFHTQLDLGGYEGAQAYFMSGTFTYSPSKSPFMGNSTWHGLANYGRYTITWTHQAESVTVSVYDQTRGVPVKFSRYLDDGGWGFLPLGVTTTEINRDLGVAWGGPNNVKTPKGERKLFLINKIPADNSSEFTLYVNGQHWIFRREGGLSMPAAGTEMILTTAFGEWNAGRTVFTQFPGPVYPGDKWLVELADSSSIAESAARPGGTVKGIMLESGLPMSCVTVHLSGGNIDEIRATKHDGLYNFAGIDDGNYTIVPFKTGFSFEPSFREIQVEGGTVEVQPFNALPLLDTDNTGDTVTVAGVLMVRAPAGRFRIGQHGVATPLHHIELDGFLIGACEITLEQYSAIMGQTSSTTGGSNNHPMSGVAWFEAVTFCNRLSESAGLTPCYDLSAWSCDFDANGFRLPTEAEWEYACRAGSYTNFFPGCDESDLARVGWYGMDENDGGAKPVGGKNPNSWGLFDTHGNVAEWCNDWYAKYTDTDKSNPTGAKLGNVRVLRGGSWSNAAFPCRSAFRDGLEPDKSNNKTGFRVVRREN